jgi:hypothetical protein
MKGNWRLEGNIRTEDKAVKAGGGLGAVRAGRRRWCGRGGWRGCGGNGCDEQSVEKVCENGI